MPARSGSPWPDAPADHLSHGSTGRISQSHSTESPFHSNRSNRSGSRDNVTEAQSSSRSAQKVRGIQQLSHERENPTEQSLGEGNGKKDNELRRDCKLGDERGTHLHTHQDQQQHHGEPLPSRAPQTFQSSGEQQRACLGASPCRLGDSARARKQATAKNAESRISTSNA